LSPSRIYLLKIAFPDIGGALYGPYMRIAILSSIVVSQLGFVSAYTIFVAENLRVGYPSASQVQALTSVVGFRHGLHELHKGHSRPVFHPDAARYFLAVRARTQPCETEHHRPRG